MAQAMKKEKELTAAEKLAAALVPETEQPYPLPGNWCWTYVGTVCSFIGGGTPSKSNSRYWNGTIPWASVKDVKGDYLLETIDHITEMGFQNSASNMCNEGELILVTRIEPAKTIISRIRTAINQDLKIVKSALPVKFLHFYFKTFRQEFEIKSSGSTVKGITIPNVQRTAFPLPPLAEQKRIVDLIEGLFADLDAAKEKLTTVLDGFAQRKAAILHRAFTGELTGIIHKKKIPLSKIAESIRIGPFGSVLHKEDYVLGGIPVINPKHISNQRIIPDAKVAITRKKADELYAYTLKIGDIVMGRRGKMGRAAPVTEHEDGWLCGTGSLIIRLKDGYDSAFYSQVIASQSSVQYLEENCVGSTMKNLNEKIIRNLPVPDYSQDEQKEIVRILEEVFAKEQQAQAAVEEVLEGIDTLKKSILARAFRGELGTGNPADESASELLRRILFTPIFIE